MINSATVIPAVHAVTESLVAAEDVHDEGKSVDETQDGPVDNFAFRLMYNEWMQNILLSNGVDGDENQDW